MKSRPPDGHLALVKLHGLGNDFLVALDDGDPGIEPYFGAALARRVCARHRGIGADGLILGTRWDPGQEAAMSFRLWNADGSEAEMSGNGMRCLAHAALDAGWIEPDTEFGVMTPAGRRQVVIHRTGTGTTWAVVDMGPVKIRHTGGHDHADDDGPCNVTQGQLLVDIGNPHLVVLGPDPRYVDVATLGPTLERSDPGGINVEFVSLGPEKDSVTMRVWERGVGETEACGTGSCAAAAALHHWGRVGRAVTVHQPGGSVAVKIFEDGTAALAGPSTRISDCVVSAEDDQSEPEGSGTRAGWPARGGSGAVGRGRL